MTDQDDDRPRRAAVPVVAAICTKAVGVGVVAGVAVDLRARGNDLSDKEGADVGAIPASPDGDRERGEGGVLALTERSNCVHAHTHLRAHAHAQSMMVFLIITPMNQDGIGTTELLRGVVAGHCCQMSPLHATASARGGSAGPAVRLFFSPFFLMRLYRALRGYSCGSRGFLRGPDGGCVLGGSMSGHGAEQRMHGGPNMMPRAVHSTTAEASVIVCLNSPTTTREAKISQTESASPTIVSAGPHPMAQWPRAAGRGSRRSSANQRQDR